MFCSKYKRKNPSYILEVFDVLCVESFMRSRGVYLHTYLGLSRSRFMSRTWWSLQSNLFSAAFNLVGDLFVPTHLLRVIESN